MKIGTKLTLRFMLMAAAILLVYAGVVWYAASNNREKEFYKLLEKEAITKANLFFDAGIDAATLQEIYRSNRKLLNEVEVAIYSAKFELLYHDAVDIDVVKETPEMLQKIIDKNRIEFYQQNWQVVGMQYFYNGNTYLITAAAYDEYGYTKLRTLLRNSILVFIFSLLFIYLAGVYFSKQILKPIQFINQRARTITATNLDLRLPESHTQDELAELTHTINDMLQRLEQSFDSQKEFVSNISHEVRTPLTALITEIELALQHKRNTDEYETALKNLQSDAQRLVKLTNALLDMAKASYDATEISMKPLRTDELLMDTYKSLKSVHPDYRLSINISNDEETDLVVEGNAYLLGVAFGNLIENACKYGRDPHCMVDIDIKDQQLLLKFSDNGMGISNVDLMNVFKPFYRSADVQSKHGYGIGLSLTHRIIQLHRGSITIEKSDRNGTTLSVSLPRF